MLRLPSVNSNATHQRKSAANTCEYKQPESEQVVGKSMWIRPLCSTMRSLYMKWKRKKNNFLNEKRKNFVKGSVPQANFSTIPSVVVLFISIRRSTCMRVVALERKSIFIFLTFNLCYLSYGLEVSMLCGLFHLWNLNFLSM